jgi:hypothetical protein
MAVILSAAKNPVNASPLLPSDVAPNGFFAALLMNSSRLSSRGAKRRGDPARIPDGLLRRFAPRNDTLVEFTDNYHPTLRRWFEVSE